MSSLCLLGCPAAYQLVEVAALSAGGRLLKQQRQAAFIEFVKPIIPGDLLERSFAAIAREIEAQNTNVASASGVSYARRTSAALFRPLANLVMIGSRSTPC
jgi:hypothetical protein